MFKIDGSKVDEFLKPRSLQQVTLLTEAELIANEDWAVNEERLSEQEALEWCVSMDTPSLATSLLLLQEASALNSQAQLLDLKATKLHCEAESVCKRGLSIMLAFQQTSKQASKQTTPPELTLSSSASSPAEVEPSGSDVPPVSKKGRPSPVMVTVDPSVNLLDMHPVKAVKVCGTHLLLPKTWE